MCSMGANKYPTLQRPWLRSWHGTLDLHPHKRPGSLSTALLSKAQICPTWVPILALPLTGRVTSPRHIPP